jgi:predicted RNA-binding protein associated with RNAse of E/G family
MGLGTPIKEIKHTLAGERQEFVCRLLERSPDRTVLLYPITQGRRVADVLIPDNSVTYAYYWTDRPYNVYHWVDEAGRTVAYYINLASNVTFRADAVEWHDLAVDLLITPDGAIRILDEADVTDVSQEIRGQIEAAQERILVDKSAVLAEVAASTERLRKTPPEPRVG